MKKIEIVAIYAVLILQAGVIAVHNEEFAAGSAMLLWYAVPMVATYAVMIGVMKKVSFAKSLIFGIVNTLVLFLVMSLLGMVYLGKYFVITF